MFKGIALLILLYAQVLVASPTFTSFPYKQGWLGADAAYSIAIPDSDRRIWFFGDSFIDATTTNGFSKRSFGPGRFIYNSIGISKGFDLKTMKYYWKKKLGSHGFFKPHASKSKFWPKAAFFHNKVLYITLLSVEFSHIDGDFTPAATYFARINNPQDSPDNWNIQYIRLLDSRQIFPGSAVVNWGPYVLMFSTLTSKEGNQHRLILTRIRLSAISPTEQSGEYLDINDNWVRFDNKIVDRAKVIFEPASTEMSIHFHETTKTWVTIYSANAFFDNTVKIRTAKSPLGPWSKPKTLFTFPEFSAKIPELFCYAAKGYEFEKNSLKMSYTCNSMNLEVLLNNKLIYTPQIANIDLSSFLFSSSEEPKQRLIKPKHNQK